MVSSMTNSFKVKLSQRLNRFHHCYQGQQVIWDIGCDHGHLGLSFLNHPARPHIHLLDPATAVINKLEKRFNASDIPRVTLFHQAGQEVCLDPHKSHFIFIAGMGGLEIIEILNQLLPQLKVEDQLLISPHNKLLEVRQYLREKGEWLLAEHVLKEAGIWYPYLLLQKTGKSCPEFGDDIFNSEEGRQYRLYLIDQLSRHRDQRSQEFLCFLQSF